MIAMDQQLQSVELFHGKVVAGLTLWSRRIHLEGFRYSISNWLMTEI